MKYFFINKLLIKAVVFSTLILHVSALICQNSNIGSYPAINTYTTCPQWDLIEQCPVTNTLYRGGTIKARCTDISLTELTFEVKKCLETNFSEGGTVHLRKDGVCQSNIQSFNYAAGQSSVTVGIPIPSNFGSNGSVSYYFIVESNSGDFFICDPINIYLTENGLTQALSIPNNEFDAGVLKLRIKSIRPSTNTEGMLRVTFEVGNLLNIDFGLYPGTYPSCEVDYQNRVATIPAGSINMANSWRPILVYSGYEDKIYTDEISVEIDPLSNPCISIMPPNPNDWSTYLSVFVAPIIDLIIELVFDEGTNEEADQYFIDNSTQLKSLIFGTISHFLVNEIGEPGVVFSDLATAANAEQMAQVISNLISHLLTDQELRSEIAGHFNSQLGSLLTEDDPYVILTELVLEGLESLVGDDPKRIRLRSKHVDYFTKATNFVAGIYDFTVFDFGYTIPIEKNYEDLFGCESDNYEPNETLQAAPLLGQWGQEGPNAALAYGTIDHPNDVDFYRVTTFGVGELDVSLGDLAKDYRLVIYQQNLIGGESNYNLLDYSNNPGTESEQTTISTCSYNFFNNTNGEATYYVKIYSVNGEHSCLNYTLNLAWNPGINNCTGSSNLGEGEGQVSRSFTSNCADCFDGILNGQEIGIDCGGPDCPSCFCNISIENISTTCLVDINRYNVHFDLTTNDYYQYNVYAYDSEGLVGSTIPLAPNGANVIFGIPNGTDIVVRVEQVDDPYGCFYEYPLIAPECDSSSPSCYSPSITALSPSIGTSFNIGDPVTLSWSSIVPPNSCFSHYQFQASFTSSFSSPAIDYSHPNTSVSFTATNPAVVYWRVRGVNSDGLTGSWSLVSFYEIVESDNSSNSQEPVVQASNLFFTSVGTDNIRANWTRGNGNECLLVCTPCGQTAANPIDGVEYFTSSNFPNAQTIGTSQSRVVYQGVSNTRNINGLDINTCYQFRVYELNNSDSSPQYNTANPPVAAQFTVDQLDLDFTWEPNPIVEDAEIDFDWISSLGGLSIEQWTFEGGDPNYDDGNGDNVIFSEPGTYNVTLEGYHAPSGQWQTVGKTITVNDDANFYGDIAFTSGTPSYLDLSPGADFTVEWVATNEGLENIVLTNTEYYFSDNAILDGSDIQFAVFNCQSSLGCDDDNHQELLSSEETFSYTRELEVPASTGIGTKYILVKAISTAAPSAGPEQNTNNNVIAIAINIVPSLPDLVIYDPVVSELTVQSGEDFDVTITFDNIGTASVYGCPKYNIYISDDELLSPDDQNYLRGHFLANASWCVTDSYINTTPHIDTRTIATSVFLPDGDYFLLFCIDSDLASLNEFAEIREDNNLVAVPIRVRNPQQPASQVENLHVSQINTSSVNITWTPGSGNYTSIIATSQSPSLYLPNDGDLYEGNTNWNQAPYWIGPSAPQGVSTTRIVYTGTGNQAQIENLPSDQTWYFTAHSYDVANSLPDYLQANASTVVTHLGEESSSWDHLFKDEDLLDYEIKQIQGFDTDANLVCMGGNDGIVLISEDGGESFLLSKLSQNQDITSTAITNDQTIYLGLYGGDIAMSTDLGQSWSTSNLSTNISIAWVFDILFLNEQTGFVLTRNADNNHAELFQTDDGGMTWGHLYSYPEKLYSITEVKGVLWMCGLNSSILRSNTNGQSWEIIQNNIPAAETINGIQFLSSDIGFLHTRSEIYKTIDGGNTWNAIRTFTGPGFLNDFGISFINENIGYIINTYGEDKGLVEMTVDGGSNWSEVFTFSDNSPLGIFCSDSQGYIFGSELGVFDLCQPTTYYLDNDGDGIGGSTTILSCFQEAGLVLITGDCDDTNPLIHPGASELCNGVDDNCNGLGDEPYLDACNQCKTIADSTFTPKIANLNTVICTGDSIILSLDLPIGAPQNFVWSSGEIAHSISVSPADTTFYSVSNISGYSNCNSSVGVFVEPCSTCYDSIQNGAETGIDCGGPNCSPCPANQLVLYNSVASASETIYFKIEVLPMTVATVLLDGEVFGSYNSTVDSLSFSSIKPAVHYLTMEIDGVEVDRRAIQFLSCGWQAYIYTDENPEAIPQCDAIKNGVAYIPPPFVDESSHENFSSHFVNVKKYEITADSLTATIRLKNHRSEGGNGCLSAIITIFGSQQAVRFIAADLFCDGNQSAYITPCIHTTVSGALFTMDNWQDLRCVITTDNIYLEGQGYQFSEPINGQIGQLIGLSVDFQGSGSLDQILIESTVSDDGLYGDRFDECECTPNLEVTEPTLLSLTSNCITIAYPNSLANTVTTNEWFTVYGDQSGKYSGVTYKDGKHLLFLPDHKFVAGEELLITSTNEFQYADGSIAMPYIWKTVVPAYHHTQGQFIVKPLNLELVSNALGTDYILTPIDANADGLIDILVSYYSPSTNETWCLVYIQSTNADFNLFSSFQPQQNGRLTEVADMTGDGFADAIFVRFDINAVNIWVNNGNGLFASQISLSIDDYIRSVSQADLDGDGDLDLIVASGGLGIETQRVTVFFNDGSGIFTSSNMLTENSVSSTVLGDVDQDGDLDFIQTSRIIAGGTPSFQVYSNNGAGTFTLVQDAPNSDDYILSQIIDLNTDGFHDLISLQPNLGIIYGSGLGSFDFANIEELSSYQEQAFVLDANADEWPDILSTRTYTVMTWEGFPLNTRIGLDPSGMNASFRQWVGMDTIFREAQQPIDFDRDGDIDHLVTDTSGSVFLLENIDSCITMNIRVGLTGPYDVESGLMEDHLRRLGYLPEVDPYGIDCRRVEPGVFEISDSTAIVDWVQVELRSPDSINTAVRQMSALIRRDGYIVEMDGKSPLKFDQIIPAGYHVVVKHRNHLAVMTQAPFTVNLRETVTINFLEQLTPAYGINAQYLQSDNRATLISGDGFADGQVNAVDINAIWRPSNGQPFNYRKSSADFNLDGSTNAVDANAHWRVNNSKASNVNY